MGGGIVHRRQRRPDPSRKGEIISYDGGMFCYRPEDNDVVHMEESLAVVYPVVVR